MFDRTIILHERDLRLAAFGGDGQVALLLTHHLIDPYFPAEFVDLEVQRRVLILDWDTGRVNMGDHGVFLFT